MPNCRSENSSSSRKDHNVQVVIRIRPLSNSEGLTKCVRKDSTQTITYTEHPESCYTFDLVADENVTQENLFNEVGLPIVENCLEGYNSCIFAYGQTGSGKTYTMMGDIDGGAQSVNCGMTPRVFEHLFTRIQKDEEARKDEKLRFTCKISYLQIYNEQILDLLDPSTTSLQIREHRKKGVYVENLKEMEITCARDVIELLALGIKNRKVAPTNMNDESSRSHSVFTCIIESKWEVQGVTHHRFARLSLVDLAGSEKQKRSGAQGERLKEASKINKSLSNLGLVIKKLVNISNGKSDHVPYRNSKLTFLLQDSLGGNSKTTMIANLSPSNCNSLETEETLKFAQRAKYIENNAIQNQREVETLRMKANLQRQIDDLVDAISAAKEREAEAHERAISLAKENDELRIQAIQNQREVETLRKKLDSCLEEKANLLRQIDDLEAEAHERAISLAKENEELASSYKKAMLERDEFKTQQSNVKVKCSENLESTGLASQLGEEIYSGNVEATPTTTTRIYLEWKPYEITLLKTRAKKCVKDGKIQWKKILAMGGFQVGRTNKQLQSEWQRLISVGINRSGSLRKGRRRKGRVKKD